MVAAFELNHFVPVEMPLFFSCIAGWKENPYDWIFMQDR
jgi:hypothetical protein